MSINEKDRKAGEHGFSLIEMLLAAAIFSIVAAVAFIFYSAAQRSYKSGENFTDQQQGTRVAFDRMISDIRLAGFNTNPDGDASRVDEQVEGAWDTAVTIRGDFDFEDPTASATPEAALAGSVYNVVSTGNDEVVTYVLAKPGATGPATLTLVLDPDRPRTKVVQTVTIPNVALVQNDPPYTLYRVTLADVSGGFPASPNSAADFIYEPVADNIKSMTFQYWPDTGAILNPDTPANAADDLGGGDAASVARSKIRRISVNLVGMTPDEDLAYVDATDATATTHYRKFDLQSDVNAENLGKSGVKDIDITPPPAPTNVALVPGHCNGILVKWDPPAASSGVTAYSVKYWVSGSPAAFTTSSVTYPHNEYGTVDYDGHGFIAGLTGGTSYCFQVQARDLVGNMSGWAPGTPPCATVSEASTPGTPQGLTATGNGSIAPQDSRIVLNWTEVQNNSNTVTGDPDLIGGTTIMRDPNGYKLYRDIVSGFTPNDGANLVANSSVLGNGVTTWTDANVANCQTYYYKIVANDTCNVVSPASTAATGQAVTAIAPSQPTGLSVIRTASILVNLIWSPVTTKVDGTATYIDTYKIYRAREPLGTLLGSVSPGAYTLIGTTTGTTFSQTLTGQDISDLLTGWVLFYTVSAADRCGNESLKAAGGEASCTFNGTISPTPANNTSGAGMVPISMSVSGTDTYSRARVRIPSLTGTGDVYDQSDLSYPFTFPAWTAAAAGPGDYTIHWEVENSTGCVQDLYTQFSVAANLACQISPTNPNLSPTNGKPADQNRRLSWDIINNSGLDLDITQLDISWTNSYGPTLPHRLVSIEYPTGAIVTSYGTGVVTPVTADYSLFPNVLPASYDGVCGTSSCALNMSMEWDTQMVNTTFTGGDLITVRFHFQDGYSNSGTCTFAISPDLSIAASN